MTKLNWNRCSESRTPDDPPHRHLERRRNKQFRKPMRRLRTDDGTSAEAWLYGEREPESVPDAES